ncbi:Uncharacterised protein [Klebsiella michiganensis]|uniref:Uncharacterized protein n=1 Tax=Klebsiella michiganensis TaxID=1134687 RepID=A0A7H4PII7_9ENTR|nr:Uncharacterised protein [Klebsiella michiganensis]
MTIIISGKVQKMVGHAWHALGQEKLLLQKILTNGSKGIKKRARLQADAAVHNFRLLIERIAGADHVLFITDGELKTRRRARR